MTGTVNSNTNTVTKTALTGTVAANPKSDRIPAFTHPLATALTNAPNSNPSTKDPKSKYIRSPLQEAIDTLKVDAQKYPGQLTYNLQDTARFISKLAKEDKPNSLSLNLLSRDLFSMSNKVETGSLESLITKLETIDNLPNKSELQAAWDRQTASIGVTAQSSNAPQLSM